MKLWLTFILIFSSSLSFSNEDFDRFVMDSKPENISGSTWEDALKAYFSHCAGGGECACVLVVADSNVNGADNSSVQMSISAIQGVGQGVSHAHLWQGWGSRKASAASEPSKNVSMKLTPCKRRNGGGTLKGNQVCVMYGEEPNRREQCRDISIFQSIMDELQVPVSAGYTSFYFSAPMQNETYKFHDFYACPNGPPCPRTLGCLGLDRPVMKALCLNHMGSNGSNGYEAPERAGGAYLHFHNTSQPRADYSNYVQGFQRFQQGNCENVSTLSLGDGSFIDPSHTAASSSYQSSGSSSNVGNAISAMEQGLQVYSEYEMMNQEELGEAPPSEEEIAKEILSQCSEATQKACPNVDGGVISSYCADVEAFNRTACEFERIQ